MVIRLGMGVKEGGVGVDGRENGCGVDCGACFWDVII